MIFRFTILIIGNLLITLKGNAWKQINETELTVIFN